ncbi:MAG: 3-oxocholest-4-en-26-oate---CoA ligase [Frankiales bacterium]|nr:3-oxocholest-4-en-26-oate---CoA ligase [Frankiales bacterium]
MTEFNIALTHEAVSATVPDREVLVWRDRRFTYADLTDRSRRLASYLHGRGLGVRTERSALQGHESGQDHLALYLHNGNEYVEGMLGAFKARVAPLNVNYRYVEDELRYLFLNAQAKAVVYHAAFAPKLAAVLDALPQLEVLLQVDDGSGHALLPGAADYEEALAASVPELPPVEHSPDDLYLLYTGGTTGMPKGVLWRQHDIFMSTMGGRTPGVWDPVSSYDDVRARAAAGSSDAMLLIPPFMHGAAQWATFIMMSTGAKVVIPDENTRMDPADVLRTLERERCAMLTVVGDAVARPLLEEMEKGTYDLSSLVVIGNGSAPLTPTIKERLLELLPNVIVSDSVGSSETGAQGSHMSVKGSVSTGTFNRGPGAVVVSEDLTSVLDPGHDGIGWFAQEGWVPLGYLGDAEKTARTFPVIEGTRYAVPGDRARLLPDGVLELLGRDAVTINTGGEKVFAEEVESAIASHPAVQDVTVCGRPSERWGSEVVAVVQLTSAATPEELETHAARAIARYKLPKAWVFVDQVVRSPSGKADYRWARAVAESAR